MIDNGSSHTPGDFMKRVVVPGYLLEGLHKPLHKTWLPYAALGLMALRGGISALLDNSQASAILKFVKGLSLHVLGALQQPGPTESINTVLMAAETVIGLSLAVSAAALIGRVADSFQIKGKIAELKNNIIKNGDIDHPLGLTNHSVLVAQDHSLGFLRGISKVLGTDGSQQILLSSTANGHRPFDPYHTDNLRDGKPLFPLWKRSDKIHDDITLRVVEAEKARKVVILSSTKDNYLPSKIMPEVSGLSPKESLMTVVRLYEIAKEEGRTGENSVKTLLFLPTRKKIQLMENIDGDQTSINPEEFLRTNGVPSDQVSIVYLDEQISQAIQTKYGKVRSVRSDYLSDDFIHGITSDDSEKTLISFTKDVENQFNARLLQGLGKKIVTLVDDHGDLNELPDTVEKICIQDIIEDRIREFNDQTLQVHRIPQKMPYYTVVDSFVADTSRWYALHVLREAKNNISADVLKNIIKLLPKYGVALKHPDDLRKLSGTYHFFNGIKGMLSNSVRMSMAIGKKEEGMSERNIASSLFNKNEQDLSKSEIRYAKTILEALHNMGVIFSGHRTLGSGKSEMIYAANRDIDILTTLKILEFDLET